MTEQPKLEYTSGDRLDLSGTVVTAYYTDGSSEVLSYTDVDFSPEHGTVLELRMDGTVITAAYGSKTTETDALTVHPKPFPQLDNWSLALMQLYSRKYVITASAGEGGSISPAGTAEVRYEQSAHYAITPCEGYVTADVLVDGVSVGAVSSYTFTSVKEHHTIEAVFKPVNPITDLSEADACYDAAMYLYEKGIMIGMDLEKGIYGTHTGLSRAMIVTILWRMEGSPVVNYLMRFEDVQPEQWYTEAVRWAASEGIVKGYSDTRFGTADSLTREQMAVILYRYAQSEGYAVFAEGDLSSFEDAGKISAWAQDAMKWAVGNELLQIADDGALHPQDTATRAQAAIMLMWFFEWE